MMPISESPFFCSRFAVAKLMVRQVLGLWGASSPGVADHPPLSLPVPPQGAGYRKLGAYQTPGAAQIPDTFDIIPQAHQDRNTPRLADLGETMTMVTVYCRHRWGGMATWWAVGNRAWPPSSSLLSTV